MTRFRTPSLAIAMAALLLITSMASNLRAQPPDGRDGADARAVQSLKATYLRCERAATEGLIGFSDAADCSVVYEELLKTGFGGDFKRLLAWWQAERVADQRSEHIARP